MPTFSFIIPVKPQGEVTALKALRNLTTDPAHYEILIAEGCKPSLQRNTAAREARGEILYFLDDDSQVAPDCLSICEPFFSENDVAVIGGPSLTPEDNSPLQKLFGLALSSLFGAGAMRNRYRSIGMPRETSDKELILCNLAMKRKTFLDAGGLDERLYPNEENELMDRLQASGKKLIHVPQLAIRRSQRSTLQQFVRQMFSYGRGRAQQTLISGGGSMVGFIPLCFLVYLLLLIVVPLHPLFFYPLYAYILLDLCFTAGAVVSSGSAHALFLALLFPLMHCANGYGLAYGLTKGRGGADPVPENQQISIRRVKEFGQERW